MGVEKTPRRGNGRTKATTTKVVSSTAAVPSPETDAVMLTPCEAPAAVASYIHPTASARGGSYVRQLDLTGRCGGETPLTQAPIDLTSVLSDSDALRTLSDDLLAPFRQSGVDLVVAVHDADARAAHGFTSAIAGALAGRHSAALGQVSVHRPRLETEASVSPSPRPRAKKRGRPASGKALKTAPVESVASNGAPGMPATNVRPDCQRVASFHHEATGLFVEYRRELLPPRRVGARVLLVCDWIDSLSPLLAAREALTATGADVVGMGFVVATSSSLLDELAKHQIVYSCSWTPTSGAQLTVRSSVDGVRCQCEANGSTDPLSSPLKNTTLDTSADIPEFQCYTSHYEANSPSEDRSVNAIKPGDPGVRLHVVLDGHGGAVAVDHLRKTLCNEIFARVSSNSSPNDIESALRQAFITCDDMLKHYLESLPINIRMSKGYCNAGSCAVVALIVRSMLYIANVGDCEAVIGRRDPMTDRVWARELSTEHNCRNAKEVKLVMERSRDRNAIRLSKDDQESENVYGVKRVAGSLAVTRAFGDFYLKYEELSAAPFKSKVPYITVEPSICKYDLSENDFTDQILVLASDGLWEVVGSEEAVKVVTQFDSQQSALFSNSSAALVHVALEKVAHRDGMLLHELMALPRGRERRRFHDDVTCTVIRIESPRPRLSSIETLEESETTRITDEEQSQT